MISASIKHVPKINMMIMSAREGTSWEEQCRELLCLLFPSSPPPLYVVPCTGGLTNRLFKTAIVVPGADSAQLTLLIRVFGPRSHLLFEDREGELENVSRLSDLGLAGRIYGVFGNGFVGEFIEGSALKSSELGGRFAAIAQELAKWHSIPPAHGCRAALFVTLRKWLRMVSSYDDLSASDRLSFATLIDRLEHKYDGEELVFCHNDLLAANIIWDGIRVRFIDYEYASFSLAHFDIANHFCEYAGFECDWSRLPSKDHMVQFLREYHVHREGRRHSNGYDNNDSESENDNSNVGIENGLEKISDFVPASHLFWGLWALIQSRISDIEFDYAGYAGRRLAMLRTLVPDCS